MALERRQSTTGKVSCVLTACPACGYEFTEFGQDKVGHFLNDHTPEDFGL